MNSSAKSEAAVSPVIGTILLVGIAVVLVAIILVVVMGFSGDTNEKKVGLNAKSETGANATLILYGGASIDELVKLEMIDQGSPNGEYVEFWNITNGSAYVGLPYLAEGVAQPEQSMAVYDTRINVKGTFSDGSEVILLVQPMTFYDVVKKIVIHPNIEPPRVTGQTMVREEGVNAGITVTHTDLGAALTGGKIYYKSADGTISGYVDGVLTGNSESGTLTGSLPALRQNTTYTVWSVFDSANGPITGPEGTFDSIKTRLTAYVAHNGDQTLLLLTVVVYNPDRTNPTGNIKLKNLRTGDIQTLSYYGSSSASPIFWTQWVRFYNISDEYEVWGVYYNSLIGEIEGEHCKFRPSDL